MIIISRRWRLPLLLIGSSGRGDSSGCCETTTNRLAAISAPKFVSLTRVRPIASSGKTHHADRRSQKATTRRPNAADTMMTEASTLTIEDMYNTLGAVTKRAHAPNAVHLLAPSLRASSQLSEMPSAR